MNGVDILHCRADLENTGLATPRNECGTPFLDSALHAFQETPLPYNEELLS